MLGRALAMRCEVGLLVSAPHIDVDFFVRMPLVGHWAPSREPASATYPAWG